MHAPTLFNVIVSTTLKATVLLAAGWVVGLLLKDRPAATRHMARAFVLCAVLLLPFFTLLMPAWQVKGMPELLPSRPAAATVLPANPAPQASVHTPTPLSASESANVARPAMQTQTRPTRAATTAPATAVTTPDPSFPSPQESKAAAPGTNFNWLLSIALVWILGSVVLACRWAISVTRLSRLIRRSSPLHDPAWLASVEAVAGSLGIRRPITLLESPDSDVPLTTGVFRPKVILPPDYSEWSAARRSAILRHELAHIKRLDALTQTLSQLAAVLYWCNPLLWLTVRTMRAERERACDDQVLAAGTKASDYAHELLDIVSGLRQPEFAAALAMARRSQLEGRVIALLNPGLRRGPVSRKVAVAMAVLTLCAVLPLAALQTAAAPRPAQSPAPEAAAVAPQAAATAHQLAEVREQLAVIESQAASTPAQAQAMAPEVEALRVQLATLESEVAPAIARATALAPEVATLQAQLGALDRGRIASTPAPAMAMAPQVAELRAKLAAIQSQMDSAYAAPPTPFALSVPAVPSVPGVPAVPAVPAPWGDDLSACGTRAKLHNMNSESHDGYKRWTASWSGDDCSVDLRAEGEIKFNAEATGIQSISSGGYFEVNERQGATLRQVRVTPSGNGLQYVYKVNGKQEPFEGDAKAWFSAFLLALERATGFAADARVPALLAKGGPTAVLDEINNLQSDYVRGIYFRKLLEQPNLPGPIVQRIITQAGERIGSDYEMARVLMTVNQQYELKDEASRTAFLTAAAKLKSDYEHSRVLIELMKRPNISRDNVNLALTSSSTIKSDYEKSRILLSLMDQKAFDPSLLDFYLKMVASIHSDYEKSRDLLAPMQKYSLSRDQVNLMMDATAGMASDYEKSRLLVGLAQKGQFDEGQMANYLKVVDSMKSDYERSRTLLELMQRNSLSGASADKAIEDISRAASDYEKSRMLTTLLQSNKFDEGHLKSFLNVMDSMKNDSARSGCLIALIDHGKLNSASLARVLEATARIKTDFEKSRVLLTLVNRYPLEGTLRESYIKVAESINGEFERNRALAAVVRRGTL
jgi:beta-lactamase regulating signal transducer with metallopeptidase domain